MTRSRLTAFEVMALIVVAVLGICSLRVPFMGDQVVHVLGAVKMDTGGILYRDFWDLKQPGIFFFNYVAGNVFGFSERGIHLFELAFLGGFAVLLLAAARSYVQHKSIAALAPLLSIGAFYAVAREWHMTQIESLVGLPVFLTAWTAAAAVDAEPRGRLLWAASGVVGGVVVLFKLVYFPVIGAFWLASLVWAVRRDTPMEFQAVLNRVLIIGVGFVLPIGAVVVYYALRGQAEFVFRTWFVYPPFILQHVPPRWQVLVDAARWFGTYFGPILGLAALGTYRILRRQRTPFLVNVVLWLGVGLVMVLAQRLWWQYHFVLLLPPLAILASLGLDEVWRALEDYDPRWEEPFATVVIGLSLTMALSPLLGASLDKLRFGLGGGCDESLSSRYCPTHSAQMRQMLAYLRGADAQTGDIYVFGDAALYWLADRGQVGPIHGYSLDGYPPELWRMIHRALSDDPPPYVFVSEQQALLIQERSGELSAFLTERYRPFRTTPEGTWFQRAGTAGAAPS